MKRSRPLTTLKSLAAEGLVSDEALPGLQDVEDRYAIAVTPHLVERIERTDPDDPIARMFVPRREETVRLPEELADPIGDGPHTPVPGIVHRYPDRVLLKPVSVCPVYCRFCFRREMVGPELGDALSPAQLSDALEYVSSHPEIREVILTGGDPFMLSAKRVRSLTESIGAIPSIDVIRWHTRMPVADPGRITPELIEGLRASSKASYVSVHINHARELSPQTVEVLGAMADRGIPLISQTVLLRGVNDNLGALSELMRALVSARVQPYYLHHPDLAPGTGHFRVSVEEGQRLYSALRDAVSGLAIPQYVIDIPGGVSKANAAKSDVIQTEDGIGLRGRDGKTHPYRGG